MDMARADMAPPTIPTYAPVDLRALAAQLPDLSSMNNLTINIQANQYTPPPTENSQLQALACNTDA
jgi:hypothetical protein